MKTLKFLTFEVLIRIVADMVIVNFTYLAALLSRLLWEIARDSDISAHTQLIEAWQIYTSTFWLLSLIALVVYNISGFYSWGRFYRSRFKALVIFQAEACRTYCLGLLCILVWGGTGSYSLLV